MSTRRSSTFLPWFAAALCLSGATILAFASWEWRGLVGWGLLVLGVLLLTVGVARRSSRPRG